MSADSSPVFRFAPSPNGWLHLGHALSAILNFEAARREGGRFLLRIEDIDVARSRQEFADAILEDLAWLGLAWEQPVRRQSQHLAVYAEALDQLKARELAYPCFCSRGDIARAIEAKERSAQAPWPRDPDGAPIYPGTCKALPRGEALARVAGGETCAWRLDLPRALDHDDFGLNQSKVMNVIDSKRLERDWREKPVPNFSHPALTAIGDAPTWTEADLAGDRTIVAAEPGAWGDVVVARRDIGTSYHLAVVVDDALQDVTHVMRGRDLYHATGLQRVLQSLLSLPEPIYTHHRLVLDEAGEKLSKSAKSTALRELRAHGFSPQDIRGMISA